MNVTGDLAVRSCGSAILLLISGMRQAIDEQCLSQSQLEHLHTIYAMAEGISIGLTLLSHTMAHPDDFDFEDLSFNDL